MSKVLTTIITGFLGAGQTTLIPHLPTHAGGRRLALIANEFGATDADGELIRSCNDDPYPEDKAVRAFMAGANPAALREAAERLAAALERGLWRPRSDSAGVLLTILSTPLAGQDHG